MIRITQNSMLRNYMRDLNRNLARVGQLNSSIASGRRFTKLSENVSDGARALRVREQIYENEQQLVNIRDAGSDISAAEGNLTSIGDILKSAQEKVLKAMTGSSNEDNRAVLAKEITDMRDQILQYMNAEFGGRFLFSGTNNGDKPFNFDATTGKLMYNGVDIDTINKGADGKYYYENSDGDTVLVPENETVYLDIGLGIRMSGDNADPTTAFDLSFSGIDILGAGTDAEGLPNNIFSLLNEIVDSISPNYNSEQLSALSNKLTKRTDEFNVNLTDIGAKTNFLDQMEERLQNDALNLSELQAKLELISDSDASMDMKGLEFAWMATLQIGSKILPQSLLDFM